MVLERQNHLFFSFSFFIIHIKQGDSSSKTCLKLKFLFFVCLIIVVININLLCSIGILRSFVALPYLCLLTSLLWSIGAY
jgi:hypothetical protein